jgi:hypothetical protein
MVGQLGELCLAEGKEQPALDYLDRSIALLRLVESNYYLCGQLVAKATTLFQRCLFHEADVLCQEGQTLAFGVNEEVHFSARLLSIRLQVALQRLNVPEAIKEFELLGRESLSDGEAAAGHYEILRLDRENEDARQKTASLYQKLYVRTPNVTYRLRYEELSGETAPDPPPLPELPEIITTPPIDLESLVQQVDQLIAQLIS